MDTMFEIFVGFMLGLMICAMGLSSAESEFKENIKITKSNKVIVNTEYLIEKDVLEYRKFGQLHFVEEE